MGLEMSLEFGIVCNNYVPEKEDDKEDDGY